MANTLRRNEFKSILPLLLLLLLLLAFQSTIVLIFLLIDESRVRVSFLK